MFILLSFYLFIIFQTNFKKHLYAPGNSKLLDLLAKKKKYKMKKIVIKIDIYLMVILLSLYLFTIFKKNVYAPRNSIFPDHLAKKGYIKKIVVKIYMYLIVILQSFCFFIIFIKHFKEHIHCR